jgi:mannose-6-phosphate isomerase-like protein (cupin superfamily)
MKIRFLAIWALSLLALGAHAQNNKVDYYSAKDIQAQLDKLAPEAKAAGSSGSTLGDFTSHALKLSVRTASGGAEVHAHFDDVLVITQGQATLITGGTVIDPKTNGEGETKGTGIDNGKTQTISVGDIIHIPAGTPHQMKIAPGILFSCFVVKVKEP